MLTHPVEVSFFVSFFSSNYGYWTTAKPELLLLKVGTLSVMLARLVSTRRQSVDVGCLL